MSLGILPSQVDEEDLQDLLETHKMAVELSKPEDERKKEEEERPRFWDEVFG